MKPLAHKEERPAHSLVNITAPSALVPDWPRSTEPTDDV